MRAGRTGMAVAVALTMAGCSSKAEDNRKAADARAAGFTPPSVTSRLDYGSAASRRFRTLDRNADDVIEAAELPRPDAPRLLELDRNKDGDITRSEFSEGMLSRFDRMDLNQDGTVTSEERRTSRGR